MLFIPLLNVTSGNKDLVSTESDWNEKVSFILAWRKIKYRIYSNELRGAY